MERRLLEAKSHLLALRPADPEAVIDVMIAMQMHTLLQQGTLLPDEKYREAYRLVLATHLDSSDLFLWPR